MKVSKILFILIMAMGTMISISANSWFAMWMGLEINMLAIIPIFSSQKNMLSNESTIKYFIIQAMASMILLMAAISMLTLQSFLNQQLSPWSNLMMNLALLIKMGAAPFHFWFPEVMEGLSWFNCLILMTWQKIAPMMLIIINKMNLMLVSAVVMISLIVSVISAFNQVSLRKILAFSSINHIAWMLVAGMVSQTIWLTYFAIYSLMNLNITSMLQKTNSFFTTQLFNSMNSNKLNKLMFSMNFFSLAGIPPMIGFLPKWILINSAYLEKLELLTFSLIMLTLIMIFVYLNLVVSSLTISLNENKLSPKTVKMNPTMDFIMVSSLVLMTLMFNPF
uniref:NADH-ubiquinone oxidoreductase chain 2 n=1 Tax=Luprops yunnanus TaxID=2984368 RepID=A0A978D7T2_9CUCU|nr:NADH dehydrogenase subunit 2 [Luprops yunnanus]UYB79043.1 NADH dehydrogenase subunit 2 [Luprops yunnanus]